MSARLEVVPTTLSEAQLFVERHHRHHGRVVGHICSLAVAKAGEVVGVAIVGRPVARGNQDGWTAEVTRCCTDGTRNACSKLYAAAWRTVRALGYRRRECRECNRLKLERRRLASLTEETGQ